MAVEELTHTKIIRCRELVRTSARMTLRTPANASGVNNISNEEYQALQDLIAKLDEMILGKRGFDYWIEYHEKKKEELILRIQKNEKEISDLRYSPITTSSKRLFVLYVFSLQR
jgi:hypothetical protein